MNDLDKSQNLENNPVIQNEERKVVKNVLLVATGNFFTLISGILVGFVIPKIMGVTDYGYYKTFTLYLTYVGIFHFGFCDGIYLLMAGQNYEELDKIQFRTFTKFFFLFQTIITLSIFFVSLMFIKFDYGFIFLFISISLISKNITTYYQYISQVTSRFRELSIRNIVASMLNIISVVCLFVLYETGKISYLSYKIYIIITTIISIFLALWYIWTYRNITFGKSNKIKEERVRILEFFKVGFFLMIANLISTLTFSLDRQFVSILYDKATYGIYAFAYNMLTLITTIVSAISVVLYPTIKKYTKEQLKNNYCKLISYINIFISFCLLSYFPLFFIVTKWLSEYTEALSIFRVILPGLVISSSISMIMFNYYKSLNKSLYYFWKCVVIFVLAFVANLIAYLVFDMPISISMVSILVMIVWYIISDLYFARIWKINTLKNLIYIILITGTFYLITYFVKNLLFAAVIYFLAFLSLSLLFHFRLFINFFKILIKRGRSI